MLTTMVGYRTKIRQHKIKKRIHIRCQILIFQRHFMDELYIHNQAHLYIQCNATKSVGGGGGGMRDDFYKYSLVHAP